MKKRSLILAGIMMTAQVFSTVPAFAEDTDEALEEVLLDEDNDLEELEDGEEIELEFDTDEEDSEYLDEEEEIEEIEEKLPRPEYDFHKYIKELAAYKGLVAEITPLEEVTDEMIMEEIDGRMYSISEEITEGTVEEGDVANIDYVGKKDGVAFDGGTAEGSDLEIGSHTFIDGFEDGLIGVKIGDTVDLNLKFPENYGVPELNGAEVVFTVTVNYVERIPEFSDEAAENLSDGEYKDMASYKAYIKEELENSNKETQEYEAQNEYWNMIIKNSVFEELPADVIEYDVQEQKDYDQNILMLYYGMSLEDYCTSYGMTMDDYESMIRDNIEMYLKHEIIEQAILEAEGIECNEDLFQEQASAYAEEYGYELEELLEMEEESNIWRMIYYDMSSDILKNNNTFTEKAAE